MKCKDCNHFQQTTYNRGFCEETNANKLIPFIMTAPDDDCKLTRSKLKCIDCSYWIEAAGTERKDDCGGCTNGGGFFPMFLHETCALIPELRAIVEQEHGMQ